MQKAVTAYLKGEQLRNCTPNQGGRGEILLFASNQLINYFYDHLLIQDNNVLRGLIIQSSAITMKTYRQLTTQMRAGNAFIYLSQRRCCNIIDNIINYLIATSHLNKKYILSQYQLLNMLKETIENNQQDFKIVELHFVKS